MISFVIWSASPEIFRFGEFAVRWYGLFFALGFLIGQHIMSWIFTKEGRDVADLDKLLLWMVVSTVLGARLGHCLFYEPEYYLLHPLDILKVWEGGLASHGATVAILLGIYLFSRQHPAYSWFYLLDRLVIVIALSGAFIRLGNLMNSEIIGKPTDVSWAFVFTAVDFVPRHPSQLYEALFCLFLFGLMLMMYVKMGKQTPSGRLFGLFVVLLFTQRILVEFTKENQVAFESALPLNMGQLLSVPLIVMGAYVLYRSYTKPLEI